MVDNNMRGYKSCIRGYMIDHNMRRYKSCIRGYKIDHNMRDQSPEYCNEISPGGT